MLKLLWRLQRPGNSRFDSGLADFRNFLKIPLDFLNNLLYKGDMRFGAVVEGLGFT
jgi:hypothetical protein